jgi:hypothetical protein
MYQMWGSGELYEPLGEEKRPGALMRTPVQGGGHYINEGVE